MFVPTVEQAQMLAEKTGSAYVCAKTPKKDRQQIISDFRSGRISTVFNVNVLSVGFDYPELAAVVDACPTMSLARHYQKIGRLTRQRKDKSVGTVIDLSGNTKRFGKVEDLEIRQMGRTYHIFSGNTQLSGVILGDMVVKKPAFDNSSEFEDIVFSFGRFKGHKISAIPDWYLSWAVDNLTYQDRLVSNIKKFLTTKK